MKLLLSGSLAIDQIMTFDGLFKDLIQPDKLRVLSISVLVNKIRLSCGGTAGNIAYSLALLGEKPILYASLGKDERSYIKALSKLGVDTQFVHFSNLPTARFSVLTDKSDCQVGGFYPGAMNDAASLSIEQFKNENVLVVISSHDPKQMMIQIKQCQVLNKKLVFDVGQQVLALSKKELLLGLKVAELLIVNDYEMGMLCKKTNLTKQQVANKVTACVVTLGASGCELYGQNSILLDKLGKNKNTANLAKTKSPRATISHAVKISAVTAVKVVDPTGAGDAYRAGFLYGYVRGWSMKKCAKLASTVAVYAVENYGTQKHKFTKKNLIKRYKQQYGEKLAKGLLQDLG